MPGSCVALVWGMETKMRHRHPRWVVCILKVCGSKRGGFPLGPLAAWPPSQECPPPHSDRVSSNSRLVPVAVAESRGGQRKPTLDAGPPLPLITWFVGVFYPRVVGIWGLEKSDAQWSHCHPLLPTSGH